MKYEKIYFYGETESGCCIQGAMVEVREDATMLEIVKAIKNAGYVRFMLQSMNRFANVPQNI